MRKSLFCIIIIFIAVVRNCSAQSFDLRHYYSLINQAELAIIDGQHASALQYYHEAYAMQKSKMASLHLCNYFLLAAITNQFSLCKTLLLELKKREWDFDSFEKYIRRAFSQTKANRLIALYKSLGDIPLSVDTALLSRIHNMCQADQQLNYEIRSKNNGLIEGANREIYRQLTSSQIDTLANLFQKRFPGDDVLGTEGSPLYNIPYSIIIIHNAQKKQPNHALDNIFYQAVKSGDLDPIYFESVLTMYATNEGRAKEVLLADTIVRFPLFPYDYVLINDSLFEYQPTVERINQCEQERNKIPGLASSSDVRKKILYQHFFPKIFGFVPSDYIVKLDFHFPALYTRYKYIPSYPKQ